MSAGKHTPGPWKPYKDGVHPVLDDGREANGGYAICGECYGPDALFNQCLIAAAPDMLAALKLQAACIDACSQGGPADALLGEAAMAMRAAIRKAEGRKGRPC